MDNVVAHTPVLVKEILALFQPKPGNRLLDATLGAGGHAQAYLTATWPIGTVVGIDADQLALKLAQENLKEFGNRVTYIYGNFVSMNDSVKGGGIVLRPSEAPHMRGEGGYPPLFNHILLDLGMGSHQLADPARGFSFRAESPLSMRYGIAVDLPPSALVALNKLAERLGRYPDVPDLLRYLTVEELAEVIHVYGEERYARRIAGAIKQASHPLTSARELADVIQQAAPHRHERRRHMQKARIHPATRTFQALRIAVNRELEALTMVLPQALHLLVNNGVLAVISFHSLEDRIVKRFMRQQAQAAVVDVLTKKPMQASPQEKTANPRSRSAKLRAVRKK